MKNKQFEKLPYLSVEVVKMGDNVDLDKIKFPCYCSYNSMSGMRYMEIDYIDSEWNCKKPFYRARELKQVDKKGDHDNTFNNNSLKDLFKAMTPIKFYKAKIVLFEVEQKMKKFSRINIKKIKIKKEGELKCL